MISLPQNVCSGWIGGCPKLDAGKMWPYLSIHFKKHLKKGTSNTHTHTHTHADTQPKQRSPHKISKQKAVLGWFAGKSSFTEALKAWSYQEQNRWQTLKIQRLGGGTKACATRPAKRDQSFLEDSTACLGEGLGKKGSKLQLSS